MSAAKSSPARRTGTDSSTTDIVETPSAGRPGPGAVVSPEEAPAAYLTVAQVATRWRVSRSIVYALVSGGQIPSVRIGLGRGTIRIRAADAAAYLKNTARDDEQTFAEHFA